MNILYITGIHPTPDNKSGGNFITERLKKVTEFDMNFKVIAPYQQATSGLKLIKKLVKKHNSDDTEWPSSLSVENIRYYLLPYQVNLKTKLNYEKIARKIANAVLKEVDVYNFDLIHAHMVYPHGYAASIISKETGIPYVVSAHGSDIHTHPYKSKKLKEITIDTLESSQKSFFVSNSLLKQAHELGYKANNSIVLYNGVDTNIYKEINNDLLEKQLNIKRTYIKRIGFVGRLHKTKGADRLPYLFKEISLRMNDIEFIVVGDGPLKEKVMKECESLGLNVRFMGNMGAQKIPYVMSVINVLVVPSRNEGLPNVILEAKACGCPTVGTNVGGISEAIGKDGLVVNFDNNFLDNFSKSVIKILNTNLDKEKIKNNAIKFNWYDTIKKQINVYENILNSNTNSKL